MNRTIYVCPGEGCSFLSMTPGQCRSHPYPCRAMGPELVPLEVVPAAPVDTEVGSAATIALSQGAAKHLEEIMRGETDGVDAAGGCIHCREILKAVQADADGGEAR